MADRDEMARQNIDKMIADGPRLRTDYNKWIIARAPGRVLCGGVGAMGIGTMWVDERDYHRSDPTYADAPIAPDAPDDFGDLAASTLRDAELLRRHDEGR